MIVDYNDPQFKRGLEVGLSCGITDRVVESSGDIPTLSYGFDIIDVVIDIVSFKPLVPKNISI